MPMLAEQMQQVLAAYNEGLALYKKREFKMAAKRRSKAKKTPALRRYTSTVACTLSKNRPRQIGMAYT